MGFVSGQIRSAEISIDRDACVCKLHIVTEDAAAQGKSNGQQRELKISWTMFRN